MSFPPCFVLANWYPTFTKFTTNTVFFPMYQEFLEYLNEERFIHPSEYFKDVCDELLELRNSIDVCIEEFGGRAQVKLLWSSPRDSGWLTLSGRPIASSFEDVCLMLKNSENVLADLEFLRLGEIQPSLALREWTDIDLSMEFRCFVKDYSLVAVCQRNLTEFFPFLDAETPRTLFSIKAFLVENFFPLWREEGSLVLDVFLSPDFTVLLLDLGPFDKAFVDPLLFEWSELEAFSSVQEPVFRIIPNYMHVYKNSKDCNCFPIEFLEPYVGCNPSFIEQIIEQASSLTLESLKKSG